MLELRNPDIILHKWHKCIKTPIHNQCTQSKHLLEGLYPGPLLRGKREGGIDTGVGWQL